MKSACVERHEPRPRVSLHRPIISLFLETKLPRPSCLAENRVGVCFSRAIIIASSRLAAPIGMLQNRSVCCLCRFSASFSQLKTQSMLLTPTCSTYIYVDGRYVMFKRQFPNTTGHFTHRPVELVIGKRHLVALLYWKWRVKDEKKGTNKLVGRFRIHGECVPQRRSHPSRRGAASTNPPLFQTTRTPSCHVHAPPPSTHARGCIKINPHNACDAP